MLTLTDPPAALAAGGPAFGLTAVVPCFNEQDNIASAYGQVVAELGRYDLEILFVDDGSSDGTLARIKELADADPRVAWISFARNFGFEAAFSAGYRYASRPWIAHLDADLQFPPSEVHHLVRRLRETGDDAAFGVRVNRDDPWHRKLGARAYHALARRAFGIEVPPGATTFRVMRAEVARRVVDLRLGTPYFLATLPRLTNRYSTVPVAHRARTAGTSKFRLKRLVGHAIELYVGFSRRAIHGAALAAAGAAALTAIVAVLGAFDVAAGPVAVLGAQVVLLLGLAVSLRYTALVADAQARPAQFYVRAASIDIDDADRLIPTAKALVTT